MHRHNNHSKEKVTININPNKNNIPVNTKKKESPTAPISPVTFFGDKAQRRNDINEFLVFPYESFVVESLNDSMIIDKMKSNEEAWNKFNKNIAMLKSSYTGNYRDTINGYIVMNSLDLLNDTIMKIMYNVFVNTIEMVPPTDIINNYTEEEKMKVIGAAIAINSFGIDYMASSYCKSEDPNYIYMTSILSNLLTGAIYNATVSRIINPLIIKAVYSAFENGFGVDLYANLYRVAFNTDPSKEELERLSYDKYYTFTTSMIRELTCDIMVNYRFALGNIAITVANMYKNADPNYINYSKTNTDSTSVIENNKLIKGMLDNLAGE